MDFLGFPPFRPARVPRDGQKQIMNGHYPFQLCSATD